MVLCRGLALAVAIMTVFVSFADIVIDLSAWKVRFDADDSTLELKHDDSGARIDGKLSFVGPAKVTGAGVAAKPGENVQWKIAYSRDGVRDRLALVDAADNVNGYLTFAVDGNKLSMHIYHRTAFAYEGRLHFAAKIDYRKDSFACRLSPRTGDRVLAMKSGNAVSALDDALFSPSADEALRFSVGQLGCEGDGRTIDVYLDISAADRCEALFAIEKNYYQKRWVPYYRPLDRSRAPHAPTGWLSWNTYFDQAGSKENLDEARFAAKWFLPFGMEIWNIESWQDGSDSLPVSKFHNMNLETYKVQFPEGMKWLADEIRKLGFRPGLWMAPYGTGNARFYQEHRDWFLHRADGTPIRSWNGKYTLDPTVPEALEHLKTIFDKASHEWGYEFFKIDGMSGRGPGYCAHLYERPDVRACFHDKTCANPFERTVKAFREGIGDDRIFLACQGHFTGAEAAYADASRTGADIVHPNKPVMWENLLLQARCTVNQVFAHSVVFWSDPDCMLVNQEALAREQAQVETTIVALPGQQTFAGDKLAKLSPDRVRLIQQALPVCDTHPAKLHPQFGQLPVWDLHIARPFGDWHVVALFNWTDELRTIGFDWDEIGERADRAFLVWEFWNSKWLGRKISCIEMQVPPRSVRLVTLQPDMQRPQFLTSDRHITQGGVDLKDQKWQDGRLVAVMKTIGGFPTKVRFSIPEGKSVRQVDVEGAKWTLTNEADGRIAMVDVLSDVTRDVEIILNID